MAPDTDENANLKKLIGQIRPSTWELLQAIVDKRERVIIAKILAVAGARRGRREQDDWSGLLEMARLRDARPGSFQGPRSRQWARRRDGHAQLV